MSRKAVHDKNPFPLWRIILWEVVNVNPFIRKNIITYRIFFFEKPVRTKDVTNYIDLTDEDEGFSDALIEVYNKCISMGMSKEEAITISGVSVELIERNKKSK